MRKERGSWPPDAGMADASVSSSDDALRAAKGMVPRLATHACGQPLVRLAAAVSDGGHRQFLHAMGN
jgi:hypothetical protein